MVSPNRNRASDATVRLADATDRSTSFGTRESDDSVESGPCAGILESLMLVFFVPGFFRLCLFVLIMGGGVTVPWLYVLPPLQEEVWGDKSTSYSSFMQAGRSLLSMLFAAYFG